MACEDDTKHVIDEIVHVDLCRDTEILCPVRATAFSYPLMKMNVCVCTRVSR